MDTSASITAVIHRGTVSTMNRLIVISLTSLV
jgi:hypothetical protein